MSEETSELSAKILQTTRDECELISGLKRCGFMFYNDIARGRIKYVKKKVEQFRKEREDALDTLSKLRVKMLELQAKIEELAYEQGQIGWDQKLEIMIKSLRERGKY